LSVPGGWKSCKVLPSGGMPPGDRGLRFLENTVRTDSAVTLASLSVVLATLALGGFVVARLSTAPTRIAGVLAALALIFHWG
jgi:hypothetical protein